MIAQSNVVVSEDIKQSVQNHIKMVSARMETYKIPLGIQHLLFEIRNWCKKQNASSSSLQNEQILTSQDSLTIYGEKALFAFNSEVPEELRQDITCIRVEIINNIVFAFCPFEGCFSKFSILENKRKLLNLSNFKRHIRTCLQTESSSDDEDYQQTNHSQNEGSTSSSDEGDSDILNEEQTSPVNQPVGIPTSSRQANNQLIWNPSVPNQRITRSVSKNSNNN